MNRRRRLDIQIRRACAEDTADVLELTSRIWDGDDYVPYVWNEWLQDPLGCLVVAEYQERVVGLAKLSQSTPIDWWMQGLRVHPDFEGHGIASRLHDEVIRHWQEHGNGGLRLATNATRYQVHHLCDRSGFNKVGEYTYYQADALSDATPDFRPLQPGETAEALAYAQASPIKPLTLEYMDLGWEWLPPRLEKIEAARQNGQALWWRDKNGLLLYGEDTEEEDNSNIPIPLLALVACPKDLLKDLLLNYRRLAGQHGYAHAGWTTAMNPELLAIVDSAGFARAWDGSVYLFEKTKGV